MLQLPRFATDLSVSSCFFRLRFYCLMCGPTVELTPAEGIILPVCFRIFYAARGHLSALLGPASGVGHGSLIRRLSERIESGPIADWLTAFLGLKNDHVKTPRAAKPDHAKQALSNQDRQRPNGPLADMPTPVTYFECKALGGPAPKNQTGRPYGRPHRSTGIRRRQ
jgi:hypothetical protein